MKKLVYSIVSIISLLCLASCAQDEKLILDPDNFVASSWKQTFDDVFVLDKNAAETDLAVIEWTPAQFGYDAIISYAIQLAVKKEGVDINDLTYTTFAITNENKYTVKVKDLNAALLSAGAIKRRPTDIVMRVEATISTAYASLTSSISEFNVTTFSSDPDLLYVIGDYTDFTTNNAEVLYSPGWNGEYEGYVYLPQLDQGIKLVEELAPEVEWGAPASFTPGTSLALQAGGNVIAPGSFAPGSNKEEILDGPGFYKMVVKITENAKTMTLYKFYKEFFVCGQRNMSYPQWANSMSAQNPEEGTGAVLTYDPEGKVWTAKHVYVPEYQTDGSGVPNTSKFEFKFRANAVGKTWANAANMGATDNKVEKGNQSGIISGTKNIPFLAAEGYYDFNVYLQEYPFRYELVPSADE